MRFQFTDSLLMLFLFGVENKMSSDVYLYFYEDVKRTNLIDQIRIGGSIALLWI
jgi:hypothetical protein